MKKDSACHAIVKVRETFDHPEINNKAIRSHSGRHRMINDLKSNQVPEEAGMMYARIKDRKTWAGYGKLTPTQCGDVLERNKSFKKTLSTMYK